MQHPDSSTVLVASPPLRTYAWGGGVLLLLLAQFGLRAVAPHPWRTFFVFSSVCVLLTLVAFVVAVSRLQVFRVTGSSFFVRRWWQSDSAAESLPLNSLSSVTVTTTKGIKLPLVVLGFLNGSTVVVPVQHQGGSEMSQFLFGQLGRNLSARSAA